MKDKQRYRHLKDIDSIESLLNKSSDKFYEEKTSNRVENVSIRENIDSRITNDRRSVIQIQSSTEYKIVQKLTPMMGYNYTDHYYAHNQSLRWSQFTLNDCIVPGTLVNNKKPKRRMRIRP